MNNLHFTVRTDEKRDLELSMIIDQINKHRSYYRQMTRNAIINKLIDDGYDKYCIKKKQ